MFRVRRRLIVALTLRVRGLLTRSVRAAIRGRKIMNEEISPEGNGHFHQAHEDAGSSISLELNGKDAAAPSHPDGARPIQTRELMIEEIKKVADKLLEDDASRGDVKMFCTALKELRYALKVFRKHAHVPKVTVFGSARTARDHPCYVRAVEFGRKMAQAGWLVV